MKMNSLFLCLIFICSTMCARIGFSESEQCQSSEASIAELTSEEKLEDAGIISLFSSKRKLPSFKPFLADSEEEMVEYENKLKITARESESIGKPLLKQYVESEAIASEIDNAIVQLDETSNRIEKRKLQVLDFDQPCTKGDDQPKTEFITISPSRIGSTRVKVRVPRRVLLKITESVDLSSLSSSPSKEPVALKAAGGVVSAELTGSVDEGNSADTLTQAGFDDPLIFDRFREIRGDEFDDFDVLEDDFDVLEDDLIEIFKFATDERSVSETFDSSVDDGCPVISFVSSPISPRSRISDRSPYSIHTVASLSPSQGEVSVIPRSMPVDYLPGLVFDATEKPDHSDYEAELDNAFSKGLCLESDDEETK